jgi:hypothetical protein
MLLASSSMDCELSYFDGSPIVANHQERPFCRVARESAGPRLHQTVCYDLVQSSWCRPYPIERKAASTWKDAKLRASRNFATTATEIPHGAHPITTPVRRLKLKGLHYAKQSFNGGQLKQFVCRDFSSKNQLTILRESSRLRSSSGKIELS